MSFKEAVQAAVNFERKGVTFYMELAAQTENRLGRRLFYNLACEEIQHILLIEDIDRKLQAGNEVQLPPDQGENLEHAMRIYFEAFKEKIKENQLSNIQGYEMAMEIENHGYKMYQEFFSKAINEKEKSFFQMMMAEEKKHFEALQNVYYYLTSSSDWFSETESRVWNWMV